MRCQSDNQGNPLPPIAGTCDLASMHLDASAVGEVTEYIGGIENNKLDYEFYQIDPKAVAGASLASSNDLYGNLYSLADYYSSHHQPVMAPVIDKEVVRVQSPCNCPQVQTPKPKAVNDLRKILIVAGVVALAVYMSNR